MYLSGFKFILLLNHTSFFQRPRKIGAKFTGNEIAPDEHVNSNLNLDYDGKRDRWNGYSVEDHAKIYEDYAKIEEVKKPGISFLN